MPDPVSAKDLDLTMREYAIPGCSNVREFHAMCPTCREIFVGRSEPLDKDAAESAHAGHYVTDGHESFLIGFREFIDKHLKEHADA